MKPAAATKKTAVKKTTTKKATKATTKPKANSGKVRKTTTTVSFALHPPLIHVVLTTFQAPAPAIVAQPKILSKTKSGRVIKTVAPPPKATRAAPKKSTKK